MGNKVEMVAYFQTYFCIAYQTTMHCAFRGTQANFNDIWNANFGISGSMRGEKAVKTVVLDYLTAHPNLSRIIFTGHSMGAHQAESAIRYIQKQLQVKNQDFTGIKAFGNMQAICIDPASPTLPAPKNGNGLTVIRVMGDPLTIISETSPNDTVLMPTTNAFWSTKKYMYGTDLHSLEPVLNDMYTGASGNGLSSYIGVTKCVKACVRSFDKSKCINACKNGTYLG